jgi:hypothetical protein
VRKHAEGGTLVILEIPLEFKRVVALMAVNVEQLYYAHNTFHSMLIKMLQLLQAKLISCPAVLRDCKNPMVWRVALLVPSREVVLVQEVHGGGRTTVVHSGLPRCTVFGHPRRLKRTTTALVDIMPIVKPDIPKL